MGDDILRHPAVAGRFYPDDPDDLRAEAQRIFRNRSSRIKRRFEPWGASLRMPAICIPDTSRAPCLRMWKFRSAASCCVRTTRAWDAALAIMSEGAWETPLGDVPIDGELAAALKQRFPALQEDSAAHRAEHAVEVELPFLQLRQPELRFVPIALGTGHFEVLGGLGQRSGRS